MLLHRGKWQAHGPVAGLVIAGLNVLAVPPVSSAPTGGGATIDIVIRARVAALLSTLQQQGIIS